VYGLEADFDFSGMRASTSVPWVVNGTQPDNVHITGQTNLSQKLDYFGTLRGRAGWANDNLLLFGTGGLAWGHVATAFNVSNVTEPTAALSLAQLAALQNGGNAYASGVRVGFAVGAGLEWKVARNWSVKGEYLFVDLISSGQTLTIPGGVATAGNLPVQVVRVGVNYFFQP
jgi:outer membrane immunogenic protein